MQEEEVTTEGSDAVVDLTGHEAGPTFTGSARHAVRRVVTRYPDLYLPIARRRHPQGAIADDTQLVIDGFTRSAVTYALVAFQVAQNGHVRVAHHLHSPAQLIQATRRGIPGLVPIRPPQDTVLSAMIREPTVSIGQWLRTYTGFYRRMLPLADDLLFARFDSVTTDLGVGHHPSQRAVRHVLRGVPADGRGRGDGLRPDRRALAPSTVASPARGVPGGPDQPRRVPRPDGGTAGRRRPREGPGGTRAAAFGTSPHRGATGSSSATTIPTWRAGGRGPRPPTGPSRRSRSELYRPGPRRRTGGGRPRLKAVP